MLASSSTPTHGMNRNFYSGFPRSGIIAQFVSNHRLAAKLAERLWSLGWLAGAATLFCLVIASPGLRLPGPLVVAHVQDNVFATREI